MDNNWKKAFDALGQLRHEIESGDPRAGANHLTERKRYRLVEAIEAVRTDTSSCKRLADIILGEGR